MRQSPSIKRAILAGIAGTCFLTSPNALAQADSPVDEAEDEAGDDDLILLEAPIPDETRKKPEEKSEQEKKPARLQAGGRVMAQARKALKAKGCEAAAPAYRVAAGMGEGFEAAQHELGDCLVTMVGASDTETTLLRQEGMFWLNRAAYAGNARAQRRLAMLHASPISGAHVPATALQWSLVYKNNPEAELYGAGPLPETMVQGLASDLSDQEVAAAEEFAANFTAIALPKYEPPKGARERRNEDRARSGQRPRRGGGRRPRQVE